MRKSWRKIIGHEFFRVRNQFFIIDQIFIRHNADDAFKVPLDFITFRTEGKHVAREAHRSFGGLRLGRSLRF